MTRRIFGIDYDTYQITVVELDLDDPHYHVYWTIGDAKKQSKGTRADERFIALCREFRTFIAENRFPAVFAYVEEPVAVPGGVNTTIRQSAVWGVIRLVLADAGVRCISVNVSTWKKEALLNGRASKEEIRDWVMTVIGLPDGLPQDVYDAAGIAAAARKAMQ